MTQRNITKEDIYIKARMLSEGVRLNVPGTPQMPDYGKRKANDIRNKEILDKVDFSDPDSLLEAFVTIDSVESKSSDFYLGTDILFDGSGLAAPASPNPYSRLAVTYDEGKVVITDGDEVLTTGTIKTAGKKWKDTPLSNGMPASAFLPGMSSDIINVVISLSCNNYNTNRGCRYCALFANPVSRKINQLPIETLDKYSRLQGEALKVATDNGWRGNIAISGGALPRHLRPKYFERLELVMNNIREAVGEEVFSELHYVYNHYPPLDFKDMYKWKELGINGTSIDLEVMDSAYFAAICPGKNAYKPHKYWKEAQEASVEVFGPLLGTVSCIVVGIEPMSSLVEGIDERLGKGVLPIPLTFNSAPGSAYEGFNTPSADWLVEASDKIADLYLKHAPKFAKAAAGMFMRKAITKGGRKAMAKRNKRPSVNLSIVGDEVMRRIQDMGMRDILGLLGGGKS